MILEEASILFISNNVKGIKCAPLVTPMLKAVWFWQVYYTVQIIDIPVLMMKTEALI